MSNPEIRLRNVRQTFRVLHERPDTLRETFTRIFHLTTHSRELQALKSISLDIREGEAVGVIGRNGSGKSTLLKLMAGILRPTSGTITVNGTISTLIELGAGFHGELTGRENILINGMLLGFSRKKMEAKINAIIAFSELGEFIDVPIRQYSTGMWMRLGFSIATETNPDILLIDEVLAVGDEAFQRKCLDRMLGFRKGKRIIVFVSHSMDAVRLLCSRVLLLDAGIVLYDGGTEEGIARYQQLLSQPIEAVVT